MTRCQHCNLFIAVTQYRTHVKHEKRCARAEDWERFYYKQERKWPKKNQPPPKWLKKLMSVSSLKEG